MLLPTVCPVMPAETVFMKMLGQLPVALCWAVLADYEDLHTDEFDELTDRLDYDLLMVVASLTGLDYQGTHEIDLNVKENE